LNFAVVPDVIVTGGASYEMQHHRATGGAPQERTVRAGYAQLAGTSLGRLSYTAGARVDDNSTFGNFTSYRAGAAYALPSATRLHAAFGTAFREPTFEESSSLQPFDTGNPDLRPERSRSWEGGVEQQVARGRASIGATYFDQRFRDMIQYNGVVAPGEANYYNLAAATSSGVELTARATPIAPLSLSASYTHLRTRVTDAGIDSAATANFVRGEPLLRRPSNLLSATAGWTFARPATSLQVEVASVGARSDRDFSDNVTFIPRAVRLPSYTTVAVAGELGVLRRAGGAPSLVLTGRVDNLFDRRYQQLFGYASPGRVVLVGARIGITR
jgi:vitamin B12 transporter